MLPVSLLGPRCRAEPCCPPLPDMLLHRYVVSRLIWAYMLSIAMTYFITLCLFPGLESEIHNCTLGEWLPILIMAIFNLSDFVGKVGAGSTATSAPSPFIFVFSFKATRGASPPPWAPTRREGGRGWAPAASQPLASSWPSPKLLAPTPQLALCPPWLQILAALPYDWRGPHLLIYSCLRVVFIPLFIMCVYPNGQPAFGHPAWPCVFSLLMGITNGYFGSVPMILAAGKVSPEQRELAGKGGGSDTVPGDPTKGCPGLAA